MHQGIDLKKIGSYIARKRLEKNFKQAELAEILGTTDKTVSRWETGCCLPDYDVVLQLCSVLDITVSELLKGEDEEHDSMRTYVDKQILGLIERTQDLEHQRTMLYGSILVVLGLALFVLQFLSFKGDLDLLSKLLQCACLAISASGIIFIVAGLMKKL